MTLRTRLDAGRGRAVLEVADTGPGIRPEIRERIFEAFFTTKPLGEGTGLGLSLCQAIVDEHGGSIAVESLPGQGATFRVELPVAEAPTPAPGTEAAARRAPAAGRRVLVVDDEPEIVQVLADILRVGGHQVETAANGVEALARLEAGDIELVISDIRMPELDGVGLCREVERRYPHLRRRFVLISGDILGPETRAFLDEAGLPSLTKPFTPADVHRVVQETLGP